MLVACAAPALARAQADSAAVSTALVASGVPAETKRWSSFLPLMGDAARAHGVELPLPFGAGLVFYHLSRDIRITDVRVGRNGAEPASVSEYASLGSRADVNNLNFKVDAWILPFVNLYAIAGYIWNESTTKVNVTLPPLTPIGQPRHLYFELPTKMEGSVAGLGMTLAGGYGPYFMTYDLNVAQADLGFDDRFKAVVTSIRAGWNGEAGNKPLRAWASATDWNTAATATATVPDPNGGTLSFEADQGPAYRYTYGVGSQYAAAKWLEFAADGGSDFHGGWYLALIPVIRF
ncbi:MAG: hypothetical protein ACRENS_03835 [Candidatus Eiseniibacteriota bacterium]